MYQTSGHTFDDNIPIRLFLSSMYFSQARSKALRFSRWVRRRQRRVNHLLSDPNAPKFPCTNCQSVFSRKHNLQYHLKFECGQMPRFNCPYCVYRTRHSSNVRAHVRKMHPGLQVYVVDIATCCKAEFLPSAS